ncbi:hypothetical protein P8452_26793 [Trifolium repens]|nr:hypothetical protein P8452_26793 [Trifolium repens]
MRFSSQSNLPPSQKHQFVQLSSSSNALRVVKWVKASCLVVNCLANRFGRSWNMAANDNHLWELQYIVLYDGAAKQHPVRPDEDMNDKLLQKHLDTRIGVNWKEAVKGAYTETRQRKTHKGLRFVIAFRDRNMTYDGE